MRRSMLALGLLIILSVGLTVSLVALANNNKTASEAKDRTTDSRTIQDQQVTAGQECPAWVHDKYVTKGPDGKLYPTWHPQVDKEFGCYFTHEHGSDPRSYVGFANSGMPAFGYTGTKAGDDEAHVGFKVYVSNDDLNGRAWLISLHQGSGGPKRALAQYHSLDWNISTKAGQPLVDLHVMADFGYAVPNCKAESPIPGSATDHKFGTRPSRRFIPTVDCANDTPYEIWDALVKVGDMFEATPRFDIDNPSTILSMVDLNQVRYMCEVRTPNEDCRTSASQWTGDKRGVIRPGQLVQNKTGQTELYTDPKGKLVSRDAPNAIRQFITTKGWDSRNCCGNQVVFKVQPDSNGIYLADPKEGSFPFSLGNIHWPN